MQRSVHEFEVLDELFLALCFIKGVLSLLSPSISRYPFSTCQFGVARDVFLPQGCTVKGLRIVSTFLYRFLQFIFIPASRLVLYTSVELLN